MTKVKTKKSGNTGEAEGFMGCRALNSIAPVMPLIDAIRGNNLCINLRAVGGTDEKTTRSDIACRHSGICFMVARDAAECNPKQYEHFKYLNQYSSRSNLH